MKDRQQLLRNGLPVGTMLNGVYRVEGEVGHGGFGIVYRAEHRVLGPVAIKEYLPADLAVREGDSVHPRSSHERGWYEDGLRGFEAEAQKLVKFQDHPNVVSCRDYFEERGTAYLVMNYEEGLSLAELLAGREEEGRPLTETELMALVEPLLAGLSAVHEAGVLHRDIKPANVLVRRKGEQPVLIDFGAAKQVVAEHSKSVAAYTEGYAAMEQVGAGRVGPWTDLYGVGALMWRIVAGGNPPWEDARWADAEWRPPSPLKVELRMQARAFGRPDPLPTARELGRGRLSDRLLDAIDRCLELKEEDRPADCDELHRLLAGEVEEPPIEVSRARDDEEKVDETMSTPEFATVTGGMERKHRGTLVGIAAVLLALVIGGTVWLGGNHGSTGEGSVSAEFTLKTEPQRAQVRLLDSPSEYRAGMDLAVGEYRVEVSAPGFETRIESIDHRESSSLPSIILSPLEKPPLETTSERELTDYLARMDGVQGSEEYIEAVQDRLKELKVLRDEQEISRNSAKIAKQRKEEQIRSSIEAEWNLAEQGSDVSMFQEFVNKWKEDPYASGRVAEAREEIGKHASMEWNIVRNSPNLQAVSEFIDKWKNEALAQDQVQEARQVSNSLGQELEARERARQVRDNASSSWDDIKDTTSLSRLDDFIDEWEDEPDASAWVESARRLRDELNRVSRLRERARSAWNIVRTTSRISRVDDFIDDWEDTEEASQWVSLARSLRRELRNEMKESSCIVNWIDGFGQYIGDGACPGTKTNYESGECVCKFMWQRADGLIFNLEHRGRWR